MSLNAISTIFRLYRCVSVETITYLSRKDVFSAVHHRWAKLDYILFVFALH